MCIVFFAFLLATWVFCFVLFFLFFCFYLYEKVACAHQKKHR